MESLAHYGKYYRAPYKIKWFKTYFASCSMKLMKETPLILFVLILPSFMTLSLCMQFMVLFCHNVCWIIQWWWRLKYSQLSLYHLPTVYGSFTGEITQLLLRKKIIYIYKPLFRLNHQEHHLFFLSFSSYSLSQHQLLCLEDNNKDLWAIFQVIFREAEKRKDTSERRKGKEIKRTVRELLELNTNCVTGDASVFYLVINLYTRNALKMYFLDFCRIYFRKFDFTVSCLDQFHNANQFICSLQLKF